MFLKRIFLLLFFIGFPPCLSPHPPQWNWWYPAVTKTVGSESQLCHFTTCGSLAHLPKPSDFTRLLWGLILLMFVKCTERCLPHSRCSVNIKHDYALFYMRWHAGCSAYSWIHCILHFQETLSIEEDTLRQRKHHRVGCLSSGRLCVGARKAHGLSVLLHLGWFWRVWWRIAKLTLKNKLYLIGK